MSRYMSERPREARNRTERQHGRIILDGSNSNVGHQPSDAFVESNDVLIALLGAQPALRAHHPNLASGTIPFSVDYNPSRNSLRKDTHDYASRSCTLAGSMYGPPTLRYTAPDSSRQIKALTRATFMSIACSVRDDILPAGIGGTISYRTKYGPSFMIDTTGSSTISPKGALLGLDEKALLPKQLRPVLDYPNDYTV